MANVGVIVGIVIVGLIVLTCIIVAIVFIVKGSKKTSPTTVPAKTTVPGTTVAPRTAAPSGGGTTVPGGGTSAPTTTPPPTVSATTAPVTQPPKTLAPPQLWTVAPTQAPTYDRNITCNGYEWALGISTNLVYVRKIGDTSWKQIPGEAVKLYAIAGQILALNASGGLYTMSCVPPGAWVQKLTNVKSVDTNNLPTSAESYFTVTYLDNTTGRVSVGSCVPYLLNSCSTISW